jgi:very-short-patch-repair endonuclease
MTIINNKIWLRDTRKKLRNNSTDAEKYLWNYLKWSNFNWLKFRRQHSIGRYIVDFYCLKQKLVIEIDWNIHIDRQEYDWIRTEYLNSCWVKVVRFTNYEILNNLDSFIINLSKFIN